MILNNISKNRYSEIITLLGAHAIPIVGVLYWGWDGASLVFLFWMEALILGLALAVKIMTFPLVSLYRERNKFKAVIELIASGVGLGIFVLVYGGVLAFSTLFISHNLQSSAPDLSVVFGLVINSLNNEPPDFTGVTGLFLVPDMQWAIILLGFQYLVFLILDIQSFVRKDKESGERISRVDCFVRLLTLHFFAMISPVLSDHKYALISLIVLKVLIDILVRIWLRRSSYKKEIGHES